MSHKHPTGVEVADLHEVFTPDEIADVFRQLDDDAKSEEKRLAEHYDEIINRVLKEYADEYTPDDLENMKPASFVSADVGYMFRDNKIDIYYIGADGKKYHYHHESYAGDFYEPPSEDEWIDEVVE